MCIRDRVIIGHAEVRQTYKVSAIGTIAGCYVKDGKITRDASVRVLRDNIVIHEEMCIRDSYKPVNGLKEQAGTLAAYEDGAVTIRQGEKEVRFEKSEVAQVRLRVEF